MARVGQPPVSPRIGVSKVHSGGKTPSGTICSPHAGSRATAAVSTMRTGAGVLSLADVEGIQDSAQPLLQEPMDMLGSGDGHRPCSKTGGLRMHLLL